ncbi:DUF1428 domain-containing protein [Dehalogenimonas sp. 4OHTPN]|uniref:DUF1428 domain-containing protein n=1 Tax=Dehalogenimonas sp. 4OHTPN TaxID=3166643 RepID=A0AAU8G9T6_9CHLR
MRYVDGFVIVVPEGKLPAYRKMAEEAGKVWKKYGALEYVETIGDDLNPKLPEGTPPEMVGITFPKMAGAKPGDTVVFSYIVFKSRQDRDEVNAKVMKDPFMNAPEQQQMPYDMKRAAYGGFRVIVEA